MFKRCSLAVICALVWLVGTAGAEVVLSQKGWEIRSPELGKILVTYPLLSGEGSKPAGPSQVTVNGDSADAKYADGTELNIAKQPNGKYTLTFRSLPDGVSRFRMETSLPMSLAGKATWSIAGKTDQPFPAEYVSGSPKLFQGDAKRFSVKGNNGGGFAIEMEYGYQQLQDNREWKTSTFSWFTASGMPGKVDGAAYMSVGIYDSPDTRPAEAAAAPPAAPKPEPRPAQAAGNPKFLLTDKGIRIDAGVAGQFTLGLPTISDVKGGEPTEIEFAADKKSITFRYPVGGRGSVTLVNDTTVKVAFAEMADEAKKMKLSMHVPITFASGGKWSVQGGELTAFPREKPEKPFLYQGHASTFAVVHPTGAGFELGGFTQGAFQQLQDNREWNWAIFGWMVVSPLPAGNPTPEFTFTLKNPAGASAEVKPMIDRFGQHASIEFEGKVKSEEELKADVQRDAEYLASLNPPQRDKYGGLPGSREKYGLKATGFFHIERIGDRQVLVDPEGNLFFQIGLCTFASPIDDYTRVAGREAIYEWLPSKTDPLLKTAWRPNDPGVMSFYIANLIRKYGEPFDHAKFVERSIERVRKWGYNSTGAFVSFTPQSQPVYRQYNFPYAKSLPMGGIADDLPGANKVWDPYTDGIEQKMDAAFASKLAPHASDPLVIGWFLTNEPVIQDVPKVVPGLKGTRYGAKRRLVEMLKETYGTIDALNAAWEMKAANFDELLDTTLIVATKTASQDMQKYMQEFLERRYSLVNTYFRKHCPNHLFIGDRWMPSTANSEMLVRTAGKYLDIVSINYYTIAMEKDFLDRMHRWSGNKPLLLSEFYYSVRDQGLTGGGTRVESQAERGLAYRNYVEQAASTGYVVGIQWFSHIDQAATGRFFEGFNGEAANIGIVNVADRPYKPFLAEAMKTNYGIYEVLMGERPPFVFDDPRFQPKASGGRKTVAVNRARKPIVLDGRMDEWPPVPPTRVDVNSMVIGTRRENFEGAFRLAYDEQNLYVFAEIVDTTPMQNRSKNESIWANDSIELFIGPENLDQGGSLQFGDRQVLIRGHAEDPALAPSAILNAPRPHPVAVKVVPGVDGKSYVIEAAIPFEALGFTPKPGQEILFDLSINDGDGGRRQLAWNGTAKNSSDRSRWGRAEFTN